MTLLQGLDLLSTFVFALVGARVAADKGLDYGGIAFIAATDCAVFTKLKAPRIRTKIETLAVNRFFTFAF